MLRGSDDNASPMNLGIDTLPPTCDVLVVGAGPAGSAAALTLARGGLDVVLVDAQAFPRDKICGDGLIPDAHQAMRKLGVLDEVMAQAQHVRPVACIGPRGGRIDVPGTLSVLPRRRLDEVLCRAAVAAGARMHAPVRFVGVLEEVGPDGAPRVVGARLEGKGTTREVRAPWVVLATGAVPQAIIAAGVCERRTPSAIALRGYVHNPAMVGRITELEVLWHPRLKPGYGWIFPCPDGVFNIGVGVMHSHAKGHAGRSMEQVNLRASLQAFSEIYAPARDLVAGGTWVGEPKGAPLRCSLEGARHSRPGMLVTGEAAGSTYAFTGEGIGKALETGILAGEALLEGRRDGSAEATVRTAYEARVQALKPRYTVYERANAVNAHPWLVDLLAWSAHRSSARLKRMSGVLEETHTPSNLLSWRAWARLVFEHD